MKLEERARYLGGSDAAAVLGLSRYKTQLEVWAEKTGQVEPEDISDEVRIILGNKLEQTVAELFTEKTGKKVHRVNETKYHPIHAFLAANIDRRVVGEDAILECKTTSAFKAKDWESEEVPTEYIVQCLHYLAVTGAKKAYIAVLIGNQDFIWKEIERDEKVINELITKEVYFWNKYVEPRVMPMVVTANDDGVLHKLFPDAKQGSSIDLDDKANALLETLDSMKADKRALEAQIEQQENEVKLLLGASESGKSNKYLVTWKNQESRRLDTERIKKEAPELYTEFAKVIQTRVLRIKQLS